MTHDDRFPWRRHPLCTCPEGRPDGFPFRIVLVDVATCAGGRRAHPPPITSDQLRQLVQQFDDRRDDGSGDSTTT